MKINSLFTFLLVTVMKQDIYTETKVVLFRSTMLAIIT